MEIARLAVASALLGSPGFAPALLSGRPLLCGLQLIHSAKPGVPLQFLDPLFEPVRITSCVFRSLNSGNVNGGAILCFGDLTVLSSEFTFCSSAKAGGSIAAYSAISLEHCPFVWSSSPGAGVVLSDSASPVTYNISDVSILKSKSTKVNGILFRHNPANLSWHGLNISSSAGRGHFGCVLLRHGRGTFRFTNIEHCTGSDFNSGLTFIEVPQFVVATTRFANLTRGADIVYSGVAFHLDHSDSGELRHCAFLKCNHRMQSSIYVRWGMPIRFVGCCFVETREFEQNNGLFLFQGCRFRAACPDPPRTESEQTANRRVWLALATAAAVGGFIWIILTAPRDDKLA
jgi:hypothetical protein